MSELTKLLEENYWDGKDHYTPKDAMGLIIGQHDNDPDDEFQTYGNRLADRFIQMYHLYSKLPINESNVLEIGCGMG